MKNVFSILFCLALTASLALAGDLPESMHGKWSLKRTNQDGDPVVQKLILKSGAFEFRMMSEGGSTLMFAKGKARVQSVGKLQVLMLTEIKAGQSDSEIEAIDMEFQAPVRVAGSTMYFASGLDQERSEAPRVDAYKKE